MKKILITLLFTFVLSHFSFAQWVDDGTNTYNNTHPVAIGATAPLSNVKFSVFTSAKIGMSISGNSNSFGSSDFAIIRSNSGAGLANSPSLQFVDNATGYSSVIQSYLGQLQFFNNSGSNWTETMRIGNNGYVGIGTTTPSTALSVNGTITATGAGNFTGALSSSNFAMAHTGLSLGSVNTTATGINNTTVGYYAGLSLTTGSNNTLVGSSTANSLTTGDQNTVIGAWANNWNNGTGQRLTTGYENVFIGSAAGSYVTTAQRNVAVGNGALMLTNSSLNTAIGYQAGQNNNSGANNSFIGCGAGLNNTTGSNNIFVGYLTGRGNTTGTNLTMIGTNADWQGSTDGITNSTAIGYNAQVTASNSFILGNGVNVGIGTTAPTEMLTLGTPGSSQGVLSFAGGTSGKIVIKPAAAAGTWNMTLPISAGTSGYILQTDGTGITSWVPAPSGSAGTLSGTSLASTIVGSSLTSVGTIATGTWNGSTVAPAYGGTGTTAAFTPGSLVFAGTSGVYSQDNTHLFWNAAQQQLMIGTATAPAGYKLAVKGNVIAESFKVQLFANWADYVFDKGYKLMPLNEVEQFVNQNHHLPGIPSAKEVKDNGLDLAEINNQLTKKVEELTLYIIKQDKDFKDQKQKTDADIDFLKKQLAAILNK